MSRARARGLPKKKGDANQVSHTGEIILGLLGTAFFTLLWKRLDRIDARLEKVGDTVMEVKGRMDEISKHV